MLLEIQAKEIQGLTVSMGSVSVLMNCSSFRTRIPHCLREIRFGDVRPCQNQSRCQDDLLLLDPTEDQEGKKINNAPAKQSLATETLDLVRF